MNTLKLCGRNANGLKCVTTKNIFGYGSREPCKRWLLLPNIVRSFASNAMEGREIQIPAPYGHIAAKEYGKPDGVPVLALHGWLDNCGSFEPLIPLILEKNNLRIVAMDEPGCGLSSHKPPGADSAMFTPLKDMKRVVDFLGWKQFSLIGHSRGAVFSLFFAAVFPHLVQSVTAIDAFSFPIDRETYPLTNHEDMVIDMHLKMDKLFMKNKSIDESAPVYKEAEAIERIMTGNAFGLTEKEARILMKRGTKQYKGGYIFVRDLRFKLPPLFTIPSRNDMMEFLSRMKCDLLLVMASDGPFAGHKDIEVYTNAYKANCRVFEHHTVKGEHYIHMQRANEVAAIMNKFLSESLVRGPVTL